MLQERDRKQHEEVRKAVEYVQDMANKSKFERLKRLMVADLECPETVSLLPHVRASAWHRS